MAASLKTPDSLPEGVWRGLLQHAYTLIDEIAVHGIQDPFWTFGGGTVLMLRYRHRMSKDIDIFVPDPHVGEDKSVTSARVIVSLRFAEEGKCVTVPGI